MPTLALQLNDKRENATGKNSTLKDNFLYKRRFFMDKTEITRR